MAQELPQYRSHKTVEAFKITEIQSVSAGGVELYSSEGVVVHVPREYVNKHQPAVGGYYVRYKDGYESFSPAGAFEEGYTRL